VYTETNAAAGNAIQVFSRSANGSLTSAGSYATGGLGTGTGLGSQGAVALSQDGRTLYAVNTGSNTISSFAVTSTGLSELNTVSSNGARPISLTTYGNLVYVLDAGGTGNISGFTVGSDGSLSPLAGSWEPLTSTAASAVQVGFNPTGTTLVVAEKGTNTIDTYAVGADGLAGSPIANASSEAAPFGFGFDAAGHLIISDAGPGHVSSYTVNWNGTLSLISDVADFNAAPCWIAVNVNSKYAYAANAHNGVISGFGIGADGSLTLLNADGKTSVPGGTPLDLSFSINGRFLYGLNGAGALNAYAVASNGSLTALASTSGIPTSTAGIAAR
jgi:6-phosphogluconolactonase (cycloisomerase 2 family)